MQTPISIIIPAFNQLDYCRQCLTSIQAGTRQPHRLILVDNGSTDGVGAYFDGIPNATVIHAGENRGFAAGVNLGLAAADGHVVLLNSDTLTPADWLERLEAALLSADDIGMVGPVSNYASGVQQIEGLRFTSVDEVNAFAQDLAGRNPGRLLDTERLVGFCLMIRDRAWREVGCFDESFGPGNFEDDDYCRRVKAAGYRLCVALNTFVFHYGHRTFAGMGLVGDRFSKLMQDNEIRFRRKWNLAQSVDPVAAQRSDELNQAAQDAFARGESTVALRLYHEAIEACPQKARNYSDLGSTLWNMNKREEALECFILSLRVDPTCREARENLQVAAAVLNRTSELAAYLDG